MMGIRDIRNLGLIFVSMFIFGYPIWVQHVYMLAIGSASIQGTEMEISFVALSYNPLFALGIIIVILFGIGLYKFGDELGESTLRAGGIYLSVSQLSFLLLIQVAPRISGGSMVILLPIYILNILVLILGPLSVILIMSGLANLYGLSRRPEFLVAAIIYFLFPMLALPMAGIGILRSIKIAETLPEDKIGIIKKKVEKIESSKYISLMNLEKEIGLPPLVIWIALRTPEKSKHG